MRPHHPLGVPAPRASSLLMMMRYSVSILVEFTSFFHPLGGLLGIMKWASTGVLARSDFFFSKLGLDTAFLRRWCPNTNVLLGCWMLHPPPLFAHGSEGVRE